MEEIQPGTRLGIGRLIEPASTYTHFYNVARDGRTTSFCGQELQYTSIDYINALSKYQFIFAHQIVPVDGSIACTRCIEIYKERVTE